MKAIDKHSCTLYYRTMNDIQELLDQLRGQKWTDASIADEIGTHRETVTQWRRGYFFPRYAKAIKIALRSLML